MRGVLSVAEGGRGNLIFDHKIDEIASPSAWLGITMTTTKYDVTSNPMEYVDIVNENNDVVGKVSKQEAHEKGLLHRTVIAEVIGSDGQWTLIQQAADRQDAGQYVSPIGGHVSSGETEDEALIREAGEEYGLAPDFKYKLVGRSIYNRTTRGKIENHYSVMYEIYSDKEPILNHEAVSYEKFTKEKLRKELKENAQKFGAAFLFVLSTFYPELVR